MLPMLIGHPPPDSPPGRPPAPTEPGGSLKGSFHRGRRRSVGRRQQSAVSSMKHLGERSPLNSRITFEVPPVTSQPPQHGSTGGGFPSVGSTGPTPARSRGGVGGVGGLEGEAAFIWKTGKMKALRVYNDIKTHQINM